MSYYLVTKDIFIDGFALRGPNYLNNQLVLDKLSASQDVFVFENLDAAKAFVVTAGCIRQHPTDIPFEPIKDFPIFELDLTEIDLRDRAFSAIQNSHPTITVYAIKNVPYQYLDESTTFKESTGLNRDSIKVKTIHSVADYNYAIQPPCVALPFFRSLNPLSKTSGIYSVDSNNSRAEGTELIDLTFSESILEALEGDLDLLDGLKEMFNLILGTHYDALKNSKGLLDFLILPLLARKLIADTFLDERAEAALINAAAWTIAIPLELLRVGAAFCLTALLSPIFAAVYLIKNVCQSLNKDNIEEETTDIQCAI